MVQLNVPDDYITSVLGYAEVVSVSGYAYEVSLDAPCEGRGCALRGDIVAIGCSVLRDGGHRSSGSDRSEDSGHGLRDPLPTVQIDGVAWTQRVIGNTVYVGGRFTTARPAGAAPGANSHPGANLLAYDISTGNLITSWAPTTNGDVLSIVPSPDGSRLYIGGCFTNVNGQIRNRIAAMNTSHGALITTFQPKPMRPCGPSPPRTTPSISVVCWLRQRRHARTRVAAAAASDGSCCRGRRTLRAAVCTPWRCLRRHQVISAVRSPR